MTLLKKLNKYIKRIKNGVTRMFNSVSVDEDISTNKFYTLSNNQKMLIRIANAYDLEDIMAIQKACYGGKAPWGRITVLNEIKNKKDSFFIVGEISNQMVAFISLSRRRNVLHITNIATSPPYQQQGIANFLIDEAMNIEHKLFCDWMTLEVRVSNTPAKNLYRKIGFIDGNIKKNYYHDNKEDALNMAYKLEKDDVDKNEKTS